MSNKKYEFVERLFLLSVQLLVKNIISSFITENVIWELRSFSKAQNQCSPYLNVCPDVDDLFRSMGRWRKLNHHRGTQRQFSGEYLFGRRFENQNFQNICCKISCLPASPRIFEHLQNGIITHFKRIFTLKKATQNFREPFPG